MLLLLTVVSVITLLNYATLEPRSIKNMKNIKLKNRMHPT